MVYPLSNPLGEYGRVLCPKLEPTRLRGYGNVEHLEHITYLQVFKMANSLKELGHLGHLGQPLISTILNRFFCTFVCKSTVFQPSAHSGDDLLAESKRMDDLPAII